MTVLSSASRYYLWLEPVDMRKSFNGLQGIVTNQLRRDALSGEVFIFINRRRGQVKMLVWDLSIPEHIERVDEIIEPQEDTTGMKHIGDEITGVFECQPGKLWVRRIRRQCAKSSRGIYHSGSLQHSQYQPR
jgi:hypothetical protein